MESGQSRHVCTLQFNMPDGFRASHAATRISSTAGARGAILPHIKGLQHQSVRRDLPVF